MPETPAPEDQAVTASRGKTAVVLLVIAVIGLALGYVVLTIVDFLIDVIWLETAAGLRGAALWALVLGVPTLAGVIVAKLRHSVDGHNPLGGIALFPITTREYPFVIGAIAVTLVGGLVLGPEVAMVSTGAWVGTVIGARAGIAQKPAVGIGALFAISALFIGPLLQGSFETSPSYQFTASNIIGAVGVGALTAGLLAAGRFLSIGFMKMHGGDRPKVHIVALAGFLVGVVALAYYYLSGGNSVGFVLTSGESNIVEMVQLGTAGAVALTAIAKLIAYSLCMGGGFRGGPYFPAIYTGAGIGTAAMLVNPSWAAGSAAAGIAAACVSLAHPKWLFAVIIGAFIGLVAGGPQLIIIGVIGGLIAKALPSVRVATSPDGGEVISMAR